MADAKDLAFAVADVLKIERDRRGWTLEGLAERSGLHRTTLGLVERHERGLTLESAARVCAALGLNLSAVLSVAENLVMTDVSSP